MQVMSPQLVISPRDNLVILYIFLKANFLTSFLIFEVEHLPPITLHLIPYRVIVCTFIVHV